MGLKTERKSGEAQYPISFSSIPSGDLMGRVEVADDVPIIGFAVIHLGSRLVSATDCTGGTTPLGSLPNDWVPRPGRQPHVFVEWPCGRRMVFPVTNHLAAAAA